MANIDSKKPISCEVQFDNGNAAAGKWVSPENPEPQPWPGKLQVSPAGLAVLLEG
jgi:hypothetical protein